MNENHEFDYTVAKRAEGTYLLKRILLIIAYVLFGAVYFFGLAAAHLYPLMAFVVLLEWILIFFTWRYVSIEYRYETASGGIRFYEVLGGKKKKLLFEKRIKDFSTISPYTDEARAALADADLVERHLCVRSEKDLTDCFYAIYDMDGSKGIVMFEATEAALKIMRFYNQNTVVTQTRY